MAVSQFKIYSSQDRNAPVLNGLSGSMVNVLDACLVNGYGTKAGAGWLKPLPNDPLTSSIGVWQQPSGSGATLLVADFGPTGSTTSGTRVALATGYGYVYGLTGSLIGSGSGQFPTTAQWIGSGAYQKTLGSIESGSYMWRKSATITDQPRPWIMFADAWGFYLFVHSGDTSTTQYSSYWFGDIFSLKAAGGPDITKCILSGRRGDSIGSAGREDDGDLFVTGGSNNTTAWPLIIQGGAWGGTPQYVYKSGDVGKNVCVGQANILGATINNCCVMAGLIPAVNATDNSLYISPVWVVETSNSSLRGRMRGFWHLCHPAATFSDGQYISGANEHAGKTFQIVKPGPFGGLFCIETSATVETN